VGSQKWGKHIPSHGQQLAWGQAALVNGGLTAMVMPNGGVSGNAVGTANLFFDCYGVTLTSSDTTVQAVTLSDGTNSITWQVGAPSPVDGGAVVPYRFAAGCQLVASAGAVTSAKSINVAVRGVWTKT
jgi:hypothetical protein